MQTKREDASLAYVLEHKNTGLFDVGPPDELHGPFTTTRSRPPDERIARREAGVRGDHEVGAHVHELPQHQPAGRRRAAQDPSDRPGDGARRRAEHVRRVGQQPVPDRVQMPRPGAQSCQDCHMPAGVDERAARRANRRRSRRDRARRRTRAIPQAEHAAPLDEITVPYRQKGFRRHELLGLNAFLLRTFQVQPNTAVLGVRLPDYMSGSTTDLDDAIGNVVHQARTRRRSSTSRRASRTARSSRTVGVTESDRPPLPERRRLPPRVHRARRRGPGRQRRVVVGARRTRAARSSTARRRRRCFRPSTSSAAPDGEQRYQPHFDERTRSRAPIKCRSSKSSSRTRPARSPRASSAATTTSRTTGCCRRAGATTDRPASAAGELARGDASARARTSSRIRTTRTARAARS